VSNKPRVANSVQKQRIIFCTYSSIYSSIVLEQLIKDSEIEVVAIINSTRVIHPKYGFIRGALKQIQLSGLRYASYLFIVTDLFRWLQPLSCIFNFGKKSVHGFAKQYGIPILDTLDMNEADAIKFIKWSNVDTLLAAHLNQLVKPVVLDLPDLECLNIHPSKLPSYKGVDPVFYALLNKETKTGVTLHKMSEDFDSGKILAQKTIAIEKESSVYLYNCQLFEEGVKLALDWMKNQTADKSMLDSDVEEDNLGNKNYDSWPSRVQIMQFKQAGKSLINLSELWKK
jgi:methionyl-tRNA formyltransferase